MVRKQTTPESIRNEEFIAQAQYVDTFSTTNNVDNIETITKNVFHTLPKWVISLLKLRNYLVGFLGLKNTAKQQADLEIVEGGKLGFFNIYQVSPILVTMGENDKHLDFQVYVLDDQRSDYNIHVTTAVQFNNSLGKAYFTLVKPFHKLIVKAMVKQAYKKGE